MINSYLIFGRVEDDVRKIHFLPENFQIEWTVTNVQALVTQSFVITVPKTLSPKEVLGFIYQNLPVFPSNVSKVYHLEDGTFKEFI